MMHSRSVVRSVRPPQDRLHPADELSGRERLGHVVVGAELQAEDAVDLVAPGRQHDDRHVGLLTDVAREVETALARQHHVEHEQVGVDLLEEERAARRVLRGVHLVALLLERVAHDLEDRVLVVDDEYALSSHATSGYRRVSTTVALLAQVREGAGASNAALATLERVGFVRDRDSLKRCTKRRLACRTGVFRY